MSLSRLSLLLVASFVSSAALTGQTYPPPSPSSSTFVTVGNDSYVYSGCPPLPVPSSGSSSVQIPWPIYAPLWWINGFPNDNEGPIAASLPPSMVNFLTLVNGVSEGQGTITQSETVGAGPNQIQSTYTLTISGSTVTEQLVVNSQSSATEGTQSQAGNYVDTFNSIYDIATGVQTYSVNYNDTVILTAGCIISTTVVTDSGSITVGYFAPIPNGLGPTGTSSNPQASAVEPISTGNGNYYYEHTDLSVSDHIPTLPLTFQRSYNSLTASSGPLGNNWSHNFNINIIPTVGILSTAVAVYWGDGHSENFTSTGISGTYMSGSGVTNTLTSDPVTGAYTITKKNGVRYIFSPSLLLSSIQDPNGRTITVARDVNNNLISLTSSTETLSFTYDSNNRITQVADLSGRTTSYSYDANGNLISETDPAGMTTQYAYISIGQLASITLPNGSVLVQTYVRFHRQGHFPNQRGWVHNHAFL